MSLEVFDYRNHTIHIEYDGDPLNPFTEFDGEPTLITKQGRFQPFDTYGADDFNVTPTRAQILANPDEVRRILADMFGLPVVPKTLFAFRGFFYERDDLSDQISSAITDYADISAACFVEVLNLCGFVADYTSTQREDLIVVITPKFYEVSGCPNDPETNAAVLASALKTARSWAEGECYGYSIENAEGEEIDATYGFLGADHEDSGLLDMARNSIDHHILWQNQELAKQMQIAFALSPNLAH